MKKLRMLAAAGLGCVVLTGCNGNTAGSSDMNNSAASPESVSAAQVSEDTVGETGQTSAPVFTPVERGTIDDLEQTGEFTYTCSYEGVAHDFILDLPEDCDGAPLIVMLHGYGQSASAMRSEIHMEEDAVPLGYAVVYVTGAPDSADSTSACCWNSGVSDNENNDVGFIVTLTGYLQDEYGLDKDRAYAAGFSNGGFMMYRLAMDAQDVFTAVASVCGKMPQSVWDRRYESNHVGVLQITGDKDELVPKELDDSAKYGIDPAIEEVMRYWADSNGITGATEESIGKNSTILKAGDGDGRKVWSVMVTGGHHGWYDESITGIDVNGLILQFFDEQK